jgi:hypothetical protein
VSFCFSDLKKHLFSLHLFHSIPLTGMSSLVEETLVPLDPNRKAFRLIGGILVERTVGDVLPNVVYNREQVRNVLFD